MNGCWHTTSAAIRTVAWSGDTGNCWVCSKARLIRRRSSWKAVMRSRNPMRRQTTLNNQRDPNSHSLRHRQTYAKKPLQHGVLGETKWSKCPCIASKRSDRLKDPCDDHFPRITSIRLHIDKRCGGLHTF